MAPSKNSQTSHTRLGPDLSPRQVAQAIGVSESSLKRWCDRGALEATKTAGGHRRIARQAVVRFLRERGFNPKHPDLLGLPAGSRLEARDTSEVLPQLVDALAAGDDQRVVALLTGLYLAKRTLADIGDTFIRPAFEQIGERWRDGDLEVFEEHRAVVVAHRSLQTVGTFLAEPDDDAPLAVSATLSGDPYSIPVTLTDLTLRELGWRTMDLGTDHPIDTLRAALRKLSPRMLCISVSAAIDDIELQRSIASLYSVARESGIALVLGGRHIDARLRQKLSCTAHCTTLGELVGLAQTLHPAG